MGEASGPDARVIGLEEGGIFAVSAYAGELIMQQKPMMPHKARQALSYKLP